jgi:hypothetical protein
MGSSGTEMGLFISTDSAGNVYITGTFEDAVDFGNDFGTTDIKTSAGNEDIFLVRINANGTYAGARRMGGVGKDWGTGTSADSSGNVYITGMFGDAVDFGNDFGTTDIKTSSGDKDIFITKLTVHFPIVDSHDFDGNNTSDVAVWRPSSGRWYVKGVGSYLWGILGDVPLVR